MNVATAEPHAYSDEIVIIRTRSSWLRLDLDLLWKFRDLLFAFAWRDIRLRYRQTFLGVAWVVLQPLLGAAIFSIVFGLIARMPTGGTPYLVISYSGLLGWTLFSTGLTRISNSLVANAELIRKVFFPRLLLPLGVIPSLLVDLACGTALMFVINAIYGIGPHWGLLLFPVGVMLLIAMALGLGMVAGSLAVRYRDIQYILPLLAQLLMYASPVGYSAAAVPRLIKPFYDLNPLVAPIELIRTALVGSGEVSVHALAYSAGAALVFLLAGLVVFRLTERKFADVI
ncbi:MAG: transporter permease [Phenylobacterium sp.]|nr:transporter permease [Phenylobacterium sp.]